MPIYARAAMRSAADVLIYVSLIFDTPLTAADSLYIFAAAR